MTRPSQAKEFDATPGEDKFGRFVPLMIYDVEKSDNGDERRVPMYIGPTVRRFGGNLHDVYCAFCDRKHNVSRWSFSGSGKRCDCGALLTYGGSLFDARARAIKAKKEKQK